jgi:hypothetical protein
MQVEGLGYIKKLEHGLPVRRSGLRDPRIEAVDEEPVLLTEVGMAAVVISNLSVSVDEVGRRTAACYYEIAVSGYGVGGGCGSGACVANHRYSITPFRGSTSPNAIAVRDLTVNAPLLTSEGSEAVEMVLRPEVRDEELRLYWGGVRPAELELLVDVKRVGNGCVPAAVGSLPLKSDDDTRLVALPPKLSVPPHVKIMTAYGYDAEVQPEFCTHAKHPNLTALVANYQAKGIPGLYNLCKQQCH